MAKRLMPAEGTKERPFMNAVRSNAMGLHPEWVQAPGNQAIGRLVTTLRATGWEVQSTELEAPPGCAACRVVLYFLGDVDLALRALMGEWEGHREE